MPDKKLFKLLSKKSINKVVILQRKWKRRSIKDLTKATWKLIIHDESWFDQLQFGFYYPNYLKFLNKMFLSHNSKKADRDEYRSYVLFQYREEMLDYVVKLKGSNPFWFTLLKEFLFTFDFTTSKELNFYERCMWKRLIALKN